MKVEKLVYGIYPKTNDLRLHLSRWEKGLLPDSTINNEIIKEKEILYERYKNLNITYTDPLFNWYDIFRPIVLLVDNMEAGPLTRYKETNTFYRMPIVHEINDITIAPEIFSPLNENPPLPLYVENGTDFNAFLPSPLSFYKMSKVDMKYETFEEKLLNIYKNILKNFKTNSLVIYETLPFQKDEVLNLSQLTDKFSVKLITTGRIYNNNIQGSPHSVVCDDEYENIEISKSISRVPGIKLIDGYNTRMESIDNINRDLEKIGSDEVILSHKEYLDFLPRIIADKKIELMSRVGE